MYNFKLLRGFTNVRFVPVLQPGVRWIDSPSYVINYFDGESIHESHYYAQEYDLSETSLQSFIFNNPNAHIAVFQAMHIPTGTLISVSNGNIGQLDLRQPDMFYRMVVINDLMIRETLF
jgi:hypothetical protein